MEKLPDSQKPSHEQEANVDQVSSIANFEDLAQVNLSRDSRGAKNLLIWVVTLTASIATILMILPSCDSTSSNICIGSNPSTANNLPQKSSGELMPYDVKLSALYGERKGSQELFSTPQNINNHENVNVVFFEPKFSTTYLLGSTHYISTRYFKNGALYTLNFPYKPDSKILYYDGSLSNKPFFTTYYNLISTLKYGQKMSLGLLTGAVADKEKDCVKDSEMCTILDVYSKNKPAIDTFLDPNTSSESTMSIDLPVYFVGVKR